ncbi:hypothetical protein Ae201684P_020310 [Aphanomyces euteiches]|uniref:Tc1-like transposase DDE domain-containing protein n=1 Tax=Aphanomyces euteiches TaxID=100861 RepID=A0A6G0WFK1_9STRA|nr:hypothetical protein Ae201684_015514 [Aphanomyces euteiches]KAH9084048.1 hypothetical protein Ae201684P_020310 [Aphanomyces euteiches]KAH9150128.1 hypothetical protein AeRB84_006978 [Aphanomyces euteiches]
MPRGTHLTEIDQAMIKALRKHNISPQEIAKTINRSKSVVYKFLANPETYGTAVRLGRPPIVSETAKRYMIRLASCTGESAKVIKKESGTPVCERRVQQILHEAPHPKYTKRVAAPKLTQVHKDARLKYAEDNTTDPPTWGEIIWSDEKKFNLDGPDGFKYYWHDLRKEPNSFFSRQNGGGSVMIWACFSSRGKSDLAFLRGNQDSVSYVQTLQPYLFPFAHTHHGKNFTFQQDGASIHRSNFTLVFLNEMDVRLFPHPALSPDLNPIENLWAILARSVYYKGKKYRSTDELELAITKAWVKIPIETLQTLVKSMPRRCFGVARANGGFTKY